MARFKDGSITIDMSDTLADMARRAVQRTQPGVLEAMEREVEAARRDVVRDWPVKTGRSSRAFKVETLFSPNDVTVRLINTIDYAPFVRPKEFFGVATGFVRIVRPRMRAAADTLIEELGPLLTQTITG